MMHLVRKIKNGHIKTLFTKAEDYFSLKLYKYFTFIFSKYFFTKFILPLIFFNASKAEIKKSIYKSVLHINTLDIIGGAAKLAYTIHDAIIKNKQVSKILVKDKYSKDKNVNVLIKDKSRLQEKLDIVEYYSGYLDCFHLSTFKIKERNDFINSDIVHLHNLHGDYFNLFALPEISNIKPCVWTLHDMFAITGHCAHSFDCNKWVTGCNKCPDLNIPPKILKDRTKELWNFKKIIYNKSKLNIVCPSKWLKEKVEKSILKDHDIRLIYHGINEKIFTPVSKRAARQKLNLPLNKKILLFSSHGGKKNYWKGGEYLDKVFDYFKKDESIIFINIGGEKSNLAGKIFNTGYIDDDKILNLYYSASDLFIYPSLAETFGLVVAESLSSGTPVITFNTGGIPEIVTHMKDGYIAKYRDADDFINGINIFLKNDKLRKNASLCGRQKVLRMFTEKRMLKDYFNLYKEIYKKW